MGQVMVSKTSDPFGYTQTAYSVLDYCHQSAYNKNMKTRISLLREATGLSQSEFAKNYSIPVRTLQNWEQGKSTPPGYVTSLLENVVSHDKITKYIISYANIPVMKIIFLGKKVIDGSRLTDKEYLIPIRGEVNNSTVYDFLESRCYENGRADLKLILEKANMESNNPYEWVKLTHGAVYEDCWWIKEESEKITWDMIKVK